MGGGTKRKTFNARLNIQYICKTQMALCQINKKYKTKNFQNIYSAVLFITIKKAEIPYKTIVL